MSDFRPGDVWRARDGEIWFVVLRPGPKGGGELHMRDAYDNLAPHDFIDDMYGPLERVFRDEARDDD